MSATVRLLDEQLDPLRSPMLQRKLPGVLTAFDSAAMRGYLQAALFGTARPEHTIERCELEVKDSTSDRILQPLVIGRIYPDQATAAAYLRERLAPLAERMRGREEIAPFATPVATIDALNMVVYVFPIDGELPVLVDVTDPRRMRQILGDMLADVHESGLAIQDCQV